jgi:hypothetical protein
MKIECNEHHEMKIFGPETEEVAEWMKLHSKELLNLYCSLDMIRANKSGRISWKARASHWGGGGKIYEKRKKF